MFGVLHVKLFPNTAGLVDKHTAIVKSYSAVMLKKAHKHSRCKKKNLR